MPNHILKSFFKTSKRISKELKRKKIRWEKWSTMHYSVGVTELIDLDVLETIENILQQKVTVDYYRIRRGTMTPHKDRGRRCCIQIPVKKVENAWTFSVKNDCFDLLNKYVVENKKFGNDQDRSLWINKDADVDYDYQKEYFDHYDGSTPYIQNVSLPHGGLSFTKEDRFLYSINIKQDTYSDIVQKLKNWI